MGESLIPNDKLIRLRARAEESLAVPGDMAEIGVYQGGSAIILARLLTEPRLLHLFDTFTGLPKPSKYDLHEEGEFACPLDEVKAFLSGLPVVFHVGEFPFLPSLPLGPFCFVHLDCDLYVSYLTALDWFWPRLSSGGWLIMDDYGVPSCPGATKAADEFFLSTDIKPSQEIQKP